MARGIHVMRYARAGYRKVSIFIKPDVYVRLVEYAVRNRMNVSDAVNKIIEDYLSTCLRE